MRKTRPPHRELRALFFWKTCVDFLAFHQFTVLFRNKLDELRVSQELCKFDMIGITESHLNTKDCNSELNIDGLKFIRRDRAGRKGGGCVLYYREDLRVIH